MKLTHAELTKELPARLYDSIVAKDDTCLGEAIASLAQSGSAGRQKFADLVANGCVEITPYVMTTVAAPSKTHLVRGKKIGYALLLPASWTETPIRMLNGWILEGLVYDGKELHPYVLQESPISEPISVQMLR